MSTASIVERARSVIAQSKKYHMPHGYVEMCKALLRAVDALDEISRVETSIDKIALIERIGHVQTLARECLVSLEVKRDVG